MRNFHLYMMSRLSLPRVLFIIHRIMTVSSNEKYSLVDESMNFSVTSDVLVVDCLCLSFSRVNICGIPLPRETIGLFYFRKNKEKWKKCRIFLLSKISDDNVDDSES